MKAMMVKVSALLLLLTGASAALQPAPKVMPLGDSITWGCNGPTIQDCHADSASYRVPLALALSQPASPHVVRRGSVVPSTS